MSWELIAYWICFGLGVTYAAVSALLTGFFGLTHGAEGADVGDVDMGHDYGGGEGHGEAFAVGAEGEPVIAPLSPATIAMFMTVFGGVGIILTSMFKLGLFLSLPISLGAGALAAALIFLLFYHLFTKMQASSETRMADVIGLLGEVTIPIPAAGVGEVAYTSRGSRLVSPARTETGEEISRHVSVRISRRVGNTLYVTPVPPGEPAPEPSTHDDLELND